MIPSITELTKNGLPGPDANRGDGLALTPSASGISFNYMVKHDAAFFDAVFGSLADSTRRDIIARISRQPLTISAIASPYARTMSLAAVSKHVTVLERAMLVRKHRRGREQVVELSPDALQKADRFLEQYQQVWEKRLHSLDQYLKNN